MDTGGLGFDCYRTWEAIIIGAIPVMETLNRYVQLVDALKIDSAVPDVVLARFAGNRDDGWFRTFDNLPVAWIDSFDNLTPEWLQEEYKRIIANPTRYNYEKLTKKYWADFIRSQVADVLAQQPAKPSQYR